MLMPESRSETISSGVIHHLSEATKPFSNLLQQQRLGLGRADRDCLTPTIARMSAASSDCLVPIERSASKSLTHYIVICKYYHPTTSRASGSGSLGAYSSSFASGA